MRRGGLRLRALVLTAALGSSATALAVPNCTGASRLVQWPPVSPIWEMCVVAPLSSSGSNGAGLEIFDVHYNGHLVLERAHAPILNVLYAPGASCFCFRDWSDQEVRFQSDNVIVSGPGGYAEPAQPPLTVCETGGSGGDVGSFRGVAAERTRKDALVLTTQVQAGWYRYTMRWIFGNDGKIGGEFGFAAINATCVAFDHTHHNYWRLDFDIDGPAGDAILIGAPPVGGPMRGGPIRVVEREVNGVYDPTRSFVAWDYASERGYRLVPGNTNRPDAFAVSDYWLLQYKPSEIDDAGQTGPACEIKFQNYLNNESIDNQDVVVWLRGGAFHEGQELDHCGVVGFTLEPVGNWNP